MTIICFVDAQSYQGVTGIRDTSYSNRAAYRKHVKKYPNIKLVTPTVIEGIQTIRDTTYCSIGDRELKADLLLPESSNHIALLFIHGGGWRSGNKGQHFPLAQQLASRGYTVLLPEYRLSTEALFPAAVYDVKAAIRWVRKNSNALDIDPEKIVIGGFSAGGELAAFMGTTGNMPLFNGCNCNLEISSHVNAVIDVDGTLSFVHPESSEGNDSKRISAGTNWFGYPKKDNFGLWQAASPLFYVGPATPATLFLNSSKASMHAGRDDYMMTLSTFDIYNEAHEYEDSPHGFCLFQPWFDDVVERMDKFMKTVMQ